MHDDTAETPDVRAELSMLLSDARRLLQAVRNRHSYRDAADHMDYEADRFNELLTNLFGDPTYFPVKKPKPVPVTIPVHGCRVFRNRRVLAVAS